MKTGDVILIPFPFSELTQTKLRPAVVICETSDHYADLVLAAITSVLHEPLFKNEIRLEPNLENGLRVPSILRCDRIMTLKKETLHIRIGRLGDVDFQRFKTIFNSLLDSAPPRQG
jgi:mRNA interferase MazF